MKYLLIALLAAALFVPAACAEINAKVGLAGGSANIAAEFTRQLRPDITGALDLGYGYNSEYSLLSAGLSAGKILRDDILGGIALTYSSYSIAVQNIIGVNTVSDKSGIGGKVFLRKPLRNGVFGEIGYDTRMGLVAEVGMQVRK